jgi:hypothetical protein
MLQADLARARSASAATAEDASALRVEADSLRKALRAMEARLAEYQAKDTEVGALCVWGGGHVGACGVGGVTHHTFDLCSKSGHCDAWCGSHSCVQQDPVLSLHAHVLIALCGTLCKLPAHASPPSAPLQVYLRIKAAMELAEGARLERDAATSTTAALRNQLEATQVCAGIWYMLACKPQELLCSVLLQHCVWGGGDKSVRSRTLNVPATRSCLCTHPLLNDLQAHCRGKKLAVGTCSAWLRADVASDCHPVLHMCTQARLADATRQLLGGAAADGGLGAAELRVKLAASEREAARTNKALNEAEAKVWHASCWGSVAVHQPACVLRYSAS